LLEVQKNREELRQWLAKQPLFPATIPLPQGARDALSRDTVARLVGTIKRIPAGALPI
jgi:hypothetical protein